MNMRRLIPRRVRTWMILIAIIAVLMVPKYGIFHSQSMSTFSVLIPVIDHEISISVHRIPYKCLSLAYSSIESRTYPDGGSSRSWNTLAEVNVSITPFRVSFWNRVYK